MSDAPSAAGFVPADAGLDQLREAALACRGCHLHEAATQTVFSRGPAAARLVLIGEQPGDVEDRRGEPFVGPAGKLLDKAIADAGLDPAMTYTTNAVKHFKFQMSGPGKRRIHATPDAAEITACRPWLVAEFSVLSPDLIVALGATAAKALFGPSFRVTQQRGLLLPWPDSATPGLRDEVVGDGEASGQLALGDLALGEEPSPTLGGDDGERPAALAMATVHPSAVLRADDRDAAYSGLVADLVIAAKALAG